MASFETKIAIRWSDCDQNRHVRHSAYYDFGAHARVKYLEQNGFTALDMSKLKIGPILFKEECSFIKEIYPNETVVINILKGSLSENGHKWTLHHEIMNEQGLKKAQLTVHGAWMDLIKRRLAVPPSELTALFDALPQGEPYVHKK